MKLVAFLEEQTKLTIPHEDFTIENFETIDAMLVYLKDLEAI